MLWLKKGLVGLLGFFLVISLFGLAYGSSFDMAFSSPNHLKTWVEQSDFYDSVISKGVDDTTSALGNASLSSQLDPVVKQNLSGVLTKAQFNNYISNIIDSNYAWLKGQTNSPNFSIDFSNQKAAFANNLGSYVESEYEHLPSCSSSQAEGLSANNLNPLTVACQVPGVSASTIKTEVVNNINSSNIVVSNPVVTANTLKRGNGQPYYTKINAPKLYKNITRAPMVFGVVSLICVIGIVFLSIRKKVAIRRLAVYFASVGIILALLSIASSTVSSRINSSLSKHSGLTSFITPLDALVNKIVGYISHVDLLFGLGYILIAVALFTLLIIKGKRQSVPQQTSNEPLNSAVQPGPELVKPVNNQTRTTTKPMDVKPPTKRLIQ